MFKKVFGVKSKHQRTQRQFNVQQARSSSSSLASDGLSRKHRPDYSLVIIALLLSVIGLIIVYAISPGLAATKNVSNNYFVVKQIIAIGLGLAAFIFCSLLPIASLRKLRIVLVGLAFIGALAVLIVGEEVMVRHVGSRLAAYRFKSPR